MIDKEMSPDKMFSERTSLEKAVDTYCDAVSSLDPEAKKLLTFLAAGGLLVAGGFYLATKLGGR